VSRQCVPDFPGKSKWKKWANNNHKQQLSQDKFNAASLKKIII